MRLTGKKALITGGTSGIGFAAAKLFIENGARVAITGNSSERLAGAVKDLGGNAIAIQADARQSSDTIAALDRVRDVFGSIDILFINAGVALVSPILDVTPEHMEEMMSVNFRGAYFTIQKSIPLMPRGSSIVLNTSWLGQAGLAGTSILSASKAALRSLARSLSAELLPLGIRVNAVSPGAIATGIYGKMNLPAEQIEQLAGAIESSIPLKRFGQAQDIASAVLFLASDESSYMLGAEIPVDGGLTEI